jgi:eukaryotic-like serine/threonine-protein kinase
MIVELEAPTAMLPALPVDAPPPPTRPVWLLPVVLLIAAAAAVGLYFAAHTGKAPQPAGPVFAERLETSTGEMLLVAAGPFQSGEEKKPVDLPAFYVDKTEVTNAAYARFCAATGHKLPQDFPMDRPNYPVVNVSIIEARDFAKWAGKQLPNGRQWEKAARGTDGRLFPWGNERAMDRANVAGKGVRPVTDFLNGASPCGALQMVGNVWELVDQISTAGPKMVEYFGRRLKPAPRADEPWYSIRGFSFQEEFKDAEQKKQFDAVLWDSSTVPARWKDLNIGFRCVKDPP